MYLKSSYPDPPVLPETNVHHIFFNRPEQTEWPDYVVHIDVETEEQIMYREFTARIQDLATGLGAPRYQGGMGLQAENGEMVGIIAENSSVSVRMFKFKMLALELIARRNISRLYTPVFLSLSLSHLFPLIPLHSNSSTH